MARPGTDDRAVQRGIDTIWPIVNDAVSPAASGEAAQDVPSAAQAPASSAAPPAPAPPATPAPPTDSAAGHRRLWVWGAALLAAASLGSLTLAVMGQQKIKALEQELVRRQQDSQAQAIEARTLARQAQELAQAAESKVGVLDARVAEAALQRSQFEDLIQQLSRSRDENLLADVEAALRVAVQQSALTGSAEPLMAVLRQSEERLSRASHPRVERVRRALARDLERVRAASVADVASLVIKLDEVVRTVDELPLLAQIERRAAAAPRPARPASAPASAASAPSAGWRELLDRAESLAGHVWQEARSLVRVTRIDNADAMMVAPDQAWFLRENLKLRLLNARLALQARQFDITQNDLREVQAALDRYFDRQAKRVASTAELLRQVTAQARALNLPRPDETLAALAAAQAGR